jgi:predicted metal-dependent HD superfamily phosphohydrolase
LLSWDADEKGRLKDLQEKLSTELSAAYSEPHRRYHTVTHVEKCLEELAGVEDCAVHAKEVRWALLFHDAVYDPRRHDNEARSADWACSIMAQLGRPEDEQARIRDMILATAHSSEPRAPDEALVVDIDLSTLGAEEAEFDDYDRAIRAEYARVPESEYRKARAMVLRSFLARKHIYRTRFYRERFEQPARANLVRALARLRSEPF